MTDIEYLRKAQLMITDEIVRICDKYNINYFLDAGSMLGAVRHNGFIPWDDDMDIGMLQVDYEKFIKAAPSELDEMYYLDNYKTNNECGLVFSKIRLKDTIYIENKANPTANNNEVFVDIFPYYYISDNEFCRKVEGNIMAILAQAILSKSGYKVWKGEGLFKRIKFLPCDVIGLLISKEKLFDFVNSLYFKHKDTKRLCINGGSAYNYWFFDKKIFNEFINHKFENRIYKIPKAYDIFLKKAYGDYMKMPPNSERYTHQIQQLDISKYKDILQ